MARGGKFFACFFFFITNTFEINDERKRRKTTRKNLIVIKMIFIIIIFLLLLQFFSFSLLIRACLFSFYFTQGVFNSTHTFLIFLDFLNTKLILSFISKVVLTTRFSPFSIDFSFQLKILLESPQSRKKNEKRKKKVRKRKEKKILEMKLEVLSS
jgi:hypothetical protein